MNLRIVGLAAVLVAGMMVAAACSGSDAETGQPVETVEPVESADDGDSGVTDPNDDGVELVSQTIDCPFDGPPSVTIGCSRVSVPENWETGEGEISLTFARIPSRSTASSPEAIVYLEGGPGGHALDTLQFQFADLWDPLLDDYDLIFFDQRGVGYSDPVLDCPEILTVTRESEDDPDLELEVIDNMFIDAVANCRQAYEADGIDVSQYNTVNNAKDADAIRQVLGYEQWNTLGISYGTKLGLEMTRQFPETIRASVLDSVYPPQVDGPASNPSTFLASLNLVSEACDAEAACAAEGNLLDRLIAIAGQLEDSPREVMVTNLLTGETDTIQATGDTIVGVVAQSLYSPFGFSDWPELLTDLENGGTDALSTFLSLERTNESFFTTGMQLAFQCHEEISFSDPGDYADLPPDPFGLYDIAFSEGDNFALCAAMDAGSAPAHQNEPVVSDVPTLILAGEFDPVTPPAWGQLAAETLPNSQVVVVAGEAHGVSPSKCGNQLVRQFLADPQSPVDDSCADDETVVFIADNDADVAMEQTVADFATGETFVLQPEDWNNQNVNGLVDSIRQNSLLDVAELLQFAGPNTVSASIEEFISSQLEIELTEGGDADVGGVVWTVKRGDNGRVAVDLYSADDGANVQLLFLISAVDERSDLVAAVLLPALEGFGRE